MNFDLVVQAVEFPARQFPNEGCLAPGLVRGHDDAVPDKRPLPSQDDLFEAAAAKTAKLRVGCYGNQLTPLTDFI